MLKLENVHIRRGDYVVADNIDLTLEQGKVYSVLGPNGTGKSSLMKTIFGEVAHKGTIRYGDEVLSKIHLQSWRKRIGYMPQDTAGKPHDVAVRQMADAQLRHDTCGFVQ